MRTDRKVKETVTLVSGKRFGAEGLGKKSSRRVGQKQETVKKSTFWVWLSLTVNFVVVFRSPRKKALP